MNFPSFVTYIASLFKSEKDFFKDTSMVLSGKLLIAVLAIITTPILTRLYGPEAYGSFALYNSVVQNLVILGTLAFPSALNTAKKENIRSILWLVAVCVLLFTVAIIIVLWFIRMRVDSDLLASGLFYEYWYLIPIGFLLTAGSLTLNSLQLRLRQFTLTTKVNAVEAFMSKTINLVNGVLKMGVLGLILSDILAKLLSSAILIYKLPIEVLKSSIIKWKELKSTFLSVRSFPLYVLPAQWMSILSTQLILWFIAFQYSSETLGKYSIALSLLNIPLHILSNSFQPVITQRFVTARDSSETGKLPMRKLMGLLSMLSILTFGILYLIPSTWFVYFLGEEWAGIGFFIKMLCWWYLVLFLDQSLNNGFFVFDKQRQKLYFNSIDFGLQLFLLTIAFTISMELNFFLLIFVSTKIIASLIRVGYLVRVTSKLPG